MENPFNISVENLPVLMANYNLWLNSNPQERKYLEEFRFQSENIKKDFLNIERLTNTPDDIFYNKIFKYSRKLEGPAHIKLGEQRLKSNLSNLRRNLKYIISSEDSPFMIAQNILDGEYKLENFAKSFWSPILHARFPDILPNWNNKTEKFLKKMGVNLTTSKLSILEKYTILSNSFKFLSALSNGQDFFNINHLMHYGTVINEGVDLINKFHNEYKTNIPKTNSEVAENGSKLKQGDKVSESLKSIIRIYKEHIKKTQLKDELYKWKLLKVYKGRPDLNTDDFFTEIKNIDFRNLMYEMAIVVKNHMAKELPGEFKICFIKLFDENEDLTIRVRNFMSDVLLVYRKLELKLGSHHDERTIATYLTYHNPNQYAFFKDSFYQKYCKLIGVEPNQKGGKYSHYMELISNFRDEYILTDSELLSLVKGFMNSDCYTDDNHLLMAQDILFQILDKGEEIIEITNEKVFKISMGEFGDKEYKEAIKSKIVLVHKNTKAKAQSSTTQGEVFNNVINEGDYFYLTYGNQGVSLLGQFIGNASQAQNIELASKGWLERSYVEVFPSINLSSYKAKKKWWTPNENSTCIEIPTEELEEANKLIFKPYFNVVFKNEGTGSEPNDSDESEQNSKSKSNPLNTILYGPPGTGKTYNTIDLAVKIAAPEIFIEGNHKANKITYEKLVQDEQIVFTTFHQSMCYEDFIEGIKPLSDDTNSLTYSVEDGLFKQLSVNAAFEYVSVKGSEASKSLGFSAIYDHLLDDVNEKIGGDEKFKLKLKSDSEIEIVEVTNGGNFLLQHKNGLRTYTVSRKRLEQLYSVLPELDNISNLNEEIRKVIGGSNASAYWAVLKKLRSYESIVNITAKKKEYSYEDKAAAVAKLQRNDFKKSGQEKRYVLIIDEINRGNVSQIFGELITLIEEDKRFGTDESLSTILPYSRSRFFVPPNLYIIGTMNTADRSVEALDTALRRRFSFTEKVPLYTLSGMKKEFAEILETINNRIEKLIDRDHRIGHSYFLNLNSVEELMLVFRDKIIPLLQEYFYGNYEKMGLVLGSGFVIKLPDEKIQFASFPADEHEYNDKIIYRINMKSLVRETEFTTALSLLMNKKAESFE